MAYNRIPAWIHAKDRTHVGLGISLARSRAQLQKEEDRLAAQRRIAEAEQQQKDAAAETAQFQQRVVSWLPKVGIALAVVVGGYFIVKALRKKKG